MAKFSLMDYMNEESLKMQETADITDYVSVWDIQPNEGNFYGLRKMQALKESIILMGGVQENLILIRLPQGSAYKYKALAGHRRCRACQELVMAGYEEFELVPATIKENLTPKEEKAVLLLTNSTQRGELTDYEKVMEHVEIKNMLKEYKRENKLDGKIREMEAEYLGVSSGQVAIYNKIATNLSDELMADFAKERFSISVAAECAALDSDEQAKLRRHLHICGELTLDDVKRIIDSKGIKGQMHTDDLPMLHQVTEPEKVIESVTNAEPEKVTESVTNAEPEKVIESVTNAEPEKVTESVTNAESEKVTESVTNAEPEKSDRICHKHRRGGYDMQKIDELLERYVEGYSIGWLDSILKAEYACIADALELLKMNFEG